MTRKPKIRYGDIIIEKLKAMEVEDAAKFGLWLLTMQLVYPVMKSSSDIVGRIKSVTSDTISKTSPLSSFFLLDFIQNLVKEFSPNHSTQISSQVDYNIIILSAITSYYIVYHPDAIATFGGNVLNLGRGLIGLL